MSVALISGALAGLSLSLVQHWTIQPLIEEAEEYEYRAAEPHDSADTSWQPSDSLQRSLFTALAAMLQGIGAAAILFGIAAAAGVPLTWRRGLLWGLAGLTCFVLAPSLGMPPTPPGSVVAELRERQVWWVVTVLATATGLWLLFRERRWPLCIAGMIIVLLPHAIGAPEATGEDIVPDSLVQRFAIAAVASQAVFWVILGAVGGFVCERIYPSE
jgi:cobalt transporter subunit CbtA